MKIKYCNILLLLLFTFLFFACFQKEYRVVDLSFLKLYSKEEIKHFEEIGFNDNGKLCKWNEDIRIKIDGRFTQEDLASLDEFILYVNPLISDLSLKRVQNRENVTIYIQDPPKWFGGHVGYSLTFRSFFSGYLRKAKVWVTPTLNDTNRKQTIHHELMHVLGFFDPNYKYGVGILGIQPHQSIDEYENRLKYYKFSDLVLAKSAIEILYNNNLPNYLKKKDFLEKSKRYCK